jgi:hypothetical protein
VGSRAASVEQQPPRLPVLERSRVRGSGTSARRALPGRDRGCATNRYEAQNSAATADLIGVHRVPACEGVARNPRCRSSACLSRRQTSPSRSCSSQKQCRTTFPEEEKVLLTFRGTGAAKFELSYNPGCVTVWRPGDTEVWAATLRDQTPRQIGGWAHIPAPYLDSAGLQEDSPFADWNHLPLPPRDL